MSMQSFLFKIFIRNFQNDEDQDEDSLLSSIKWNPHP